MTTADLMPHDRDALEQPTLGQALQFYAFTGASVVLFVLLIVSILGRAGA